MVCSSYYDQGRRDYEKTGEREAVLTTHHATPRVEEETCRARGGPVCRYRPSGDTAPTR